MGQTTTQSQGFAESAAARNRTAVSHLTGGCRDLPATAALDPPGVQPGSGDLQSPALALSYGSVGGRGRIRTCDGARAHAVKSRVPSSARPRVRGEPGRI